MFLPPPLLFLRRPWQGGCGRHSRVPAGRDGALVSAVGLLPRAQEGSTLAFLPGVRLEATQVFINGSAALNPLGQGRRSLQ